MLGYTLRGRHFIGRMKRGQIEKELFDQISLSTITTEQK